MKNLENKVAIVTGAASGIGKAAAILYAAEGAKVTVSDIDEEGGKETVFQITAKGGEAFFIKADTSKPADHQSLVEKTIKQFGALHIAFNNAGIGGSLLPVAEYPVDVYGYVSDVSNLSPLYASLSGNGIGDTGSGGAAPVADETTHCAPFIST